MTELEDKLLKIAYDAFNSCEEIAEVVYIDENNIPLDRKLVGQYRNALKMLSDDSYICIKGHALRSSVFSITSKGRDYIEGVNREPQFAQFINNGGQTVNIVDSTNITSNNFNQLTQDLKSSDIPDEYIKLLETLIYEIKNPNLDKPSRLNKIKDFLIEIVGKEVPTHALNLLTSILANQFV